jgi:lysozyme
MKTSDRGVIALLLHEGIVPGPYLDSVGVWTYGVGHTAAAGQPNPATMPRGMPDDLDAALRDVFDVFRRDLVKYEQAVNRALRVQVKQHEFDALVSFHYNTGGIARAKLTAHLNNGDRKAAAAAFMGWVRPPEIKGRRKAEQALFETGRYPEGNIPVFPVSSSGRVTFRAVRSIRPSEALALISGGKPAPAQPDPAEQPRGLLAAILALVARIAERWKA